MKIGFVLDDTLDSTDGVQQYILTVGQWMSKNGHEVHYLVGETNRSDVLNIYSLTKNIKVKFNKNHMSIPLVVKKSNVISLLKKLKLDVIHVQMPYSPQMAARVINAADSTTAVIATFHILPFSKKEKIATKLLASVVKKSLKRIDQVISVSEPAAMFAKSSFGVSSIVIPNPVEFPDKIRAKAKGNEKKVKLVYLGRLVSRKGVLELLKAFRLLLETSPDINAYLEIGGGGHLREKIDAYVVSNKLTDRVKVLGYVKESDKVELLSSADIAVFPSLGGESFGIVLTEAIASGAGVVVGGDNAGYRSVLQDDSYMIDPQNTKTFSDRLKVLINDEKLRMKLHGEQVQLVKQYNIEVVGPKILGVYQTLIAKNKQ